MARSSCSPPRALTRRIHRASVEISAKLAARALESRSDVTISVIVASGASPSCLHLTLESLQRQYFPASRWELVLVDNASADGSSDIMRGYSSGCHCAYVRMAARAARAELFNKGVESSRGSILLFLHPDRIVGPDFLLRHLLPYLAQEPHPAIVLGRDENDILTHLFTQEESRGNSAPIQTMLSPAELHDDVRLSKLTIPRAGATTAVFSHFHARRRQPPHPWSHFCSANASIYRTAFDASGGFDERFGDWGVEDIDLGMRLHRAGYRFAFAPEAASIRQVQPASEGNVRLLDRDICLLLSMHPDMTSVEREIVRRTSFIPSAH